MSTSPPRTLRDELAMAALAGGLEQGTQHNMAIGSVDSDWFHPAWFVARRAYAIADAMLAARQAPKVRARPGDAGLA